MANEIQAKDVILLIVYLVILLVGAYYLTKFVSRRAMKKGVKKQPFSGSKIKWKQGQLVSVVDRVPIDRDKTIMVVEFAGKHYLMATTGQDIKLLDTVELQKEGQEENTEEQASQPPMQDTASLVEEESFLRKFWSNFKVVSRNYYKNKNTTPFGMHLRKELGSKEEDEDIHPDNGENGSS
jgi:flagellar biogenesis protein FliO